MFCAAVAAVQDAEAPARLEIVLSGTGNPVAREAWRAEQTD